VKRIPSPARAAAFAVAQIVVNGQAVALNLWDTAGQEEYRSLVSLYFRSAAVAVIVFDLTSRESFAAVPARRADVLGTCGQREPALIVVANTLDLRERRAVFEDEIADLAGRLACASFEVSGLEGTNVDALFRGIGLVAVPPARSDDEGQLQERTQTQCC
jgi:small GTP-binding protein